MKLIDNERALCYPYCDKEGQFPQQSTRTNCRRTRTKASPCMASPFFYNPFSISIVLLLVRIGWWVLVRERARVT